MNDHLTVDELTRFIDFYIEALENIAQGNTRFFESADLLPLQQVPFSYKITTNPVAINFSGGGGN